nr:hypothetical protein [Tanacetum cinerariifolium]
MKTNKINLFTQSSTSTDHLTAIDLKIKLLNRIHSNKSNETHTTHQKLYDTLYETITIYQDALDAQVAQSSFHKRSHDNQDPPNNREGENKKKNQKDFDEPSSRSSRRNRSLVVIVQDDTPAMQPLDQADILIQKIPNQNGFQRSREEKYTISITKHYVARYYKEEDKIDFFKARMSVVIEGNIYSNLRIKSVVCVFVKKKWSYGFLTSIVVRRLDDKEYEFSYADLPRLSVNDVEDMYLLQVQDKLHHLPLEFMKDLNNALLMFIRRTVV